MLTNILNKTKQVSQELDFDRLLESRDRAERMAIQELYVSAVEDRVAELTEQLRAQITEELRVQFSAELESRVASIRSQYEQRSQNGRRDDFFTAVPPELVEEIAATQAELLKRENELSRSLADDASPLGAISRLRAETRELTSYLKGLNFCGKVALERR